MTDLEERIRTNLHAAGARLPDAAGGVALRPQQRPSRLRGPRVGVAALVVLLVILGVPFWLMGRDTAGDPTAGPPDTVPGEQRNGQPQLLFAPESARVVDVNVSRTAPSQADWAGGLVASPTGVAYRLSVRPSGAGETWSSADTRVVGDRTFLAEDDPDNAVTAYVHTDACATVLLLSSAEEPRWNDDALALLAGLAIDGRSVDVDLPAGWQDHGAGGSGPLYQVSFEVPVGDEYHQVALRQMPGSPVAALPALAAGPLTPTSVDGGPAWVRQRPGGPVALVWDEDGVAVMLEADGLTADELRDLAPTLRRGATSRWESAPVADLPDATVPPDAPRHAPAGCGPTRLTVS